MNIEMLERKATEMRLRVLESIFNSRKGHIGGALSCIDILVALYHGHVLRFDPANPLWNQRDRFILSKGHSSIALFAVLADLGFFSSSELSLFCQDGSRLGGHPDRRVPGVEADTGSLGHGLGIGAGLALAAKMDDKDYITFVLLGDGECYEGSVWEAFLFAAHHRLTNLVAIIDRNQQCVLDYTEDCVRIDPLSDKLNSFGWDVATIDGHSHQSLQKTLAAARGGASERPLAVVARTVKGKGIPFMEGKIEWHHGIPSQAQFEQGQKALWQKLITSQPGDRTA